MLKLRQELSEEELSQALDHCANEPIHIPGSIQTHGCLLVVDPKTYKIQQVSENIERFTGFAPEECLGAELNMILGADLVCSILPVVVEEELQPIQSARISVKGKDYDVAAHRSGPSLIVELEPAPLAETEHAISFYDSTRNFAVQVHKAKNLQSLFDHVVSSIRQLSGFDRVKLYKFDQDWNGSVIAESRSDAITSYLGMRFPASDIPEQARTLYTKNYLRLIPDIYYAPVPIVPVANPVTAKPLDLSLSMLRSVSPVHIQYLDNMCIRASMSVSIIQNGKLWGLVACHHNSTLFVPYKARMVAEIMGHIFSAQLSTMESQVKKEGETKHYFYIERLNSVLAKDSQIDTLMDNSYELALDAMKAKGMIVTAKGGILRYGEVPDEQRIKKLIEWLGAHQNRTIFHTTDGKDHDIEGGLLSASLSQDKSDFIVWFRTPIIEEVNWAGNPEKPLEETKAGYRLTPRGSFNLWKQKVSQSSERWTDNDIDTARSVVNIVLESEKLSARRESVAKSEFLANMSHEIRTPMNAVMGLAGILAMSKPLTPKQKEFIETLQMSADALLKLINELLDMAKIESRSLELEEVPFDLGQLLFEVESMMAIRIKEKKLDFHNDSDCIKGRHFVGDPSRIRQIILNLLSNAIKFTEKGEVSLTVTCDTSLGNGTEKINIQVKDSGIGIPPEKLDVIFQKFVQADSSINRKFGGTGLGLAITKTLADLMSGTVTVTSEKGKGSVFTLSLPLKVATGEEDLMGHESFGYSSEKPALEKAAQHILLVEDYAPNVMVAKTYLEEFGYAVDVASNGREAFDMASHGNYVAILMDVQMHGMNGFESTRIIREHEANKKLNRIPIIGMTAHALVGDRERCLAAGMDDYISKPFNPTTLQEILTAYVPAV